MAGLVQVALRSALEVPKKTVTKDVARLISTSPVQNGNRHQYKTPPDRFKKALTATSAATAAKRIESVAASLASKGFLRSRNSYEPPEDTASRIKEIFDAAKIRTTENLQQHTLENKFKILEACSKRFSHSVPNSQIHEMKTFDDIVKFYETPVDTKTPLETLRKAQLPENLHIQHEYVRFHPDTDTMFGGKTAFPKSSTLVTGLKYRNKYQGHVAKRSWP